MNSIIKKVSYAILALSFSTPLFSQEPGNIRFGNEGEKVTINGVTYDLIEEDTTNGGHFYKVFDGNYNMVIPAWDSEEKRAGGFCQNNERPAALRIMLNMQEKLKKFLESDGKYFGQATSVKNISHSPAGSVFTSYSFFDTAIDVISAEGETEVIYFKTCSPEVAEDFCGESVVGLTREEIEEKFGKDENGRSSIYYAFEAGDTYHISCSFTFHDNKVCEIIFGENDYLQNYSGYLSMQLPEANLSTIARCLGDSVRIRKSPVDGEVIGKADKADTLYIVDFEKQPNNSIWAHIKTSKGLDGWMHSDYVSCSDVSPSANSQLVNHLIYYREYYDKFADQESNDFPRVIVKESGAEICFDENSIKIGEDCSKLKELLPFFKKCMFICPDSFEATDWVEIEDNFCHAKIIFRVVDNKITSFIIETGYR